MGKWKYANWLAVVIILAHMYSYFSWRYEAHATVYVLATVAWLALAISGYYIYVYRMHRPGDLGGQAAPPPASAPKPSGKERPKVAFKKKG